MCNFVVGHQFIKKLKGSGVGEINFTTMKLAHPADCNTQTYCGVNASNAYNVQFTENVPFRAFCAIPEMLFE